MNQVYRQTTVMGGVILGVGLLVGCQPLLRSSMELDLPPTAESFHGGDLSDRQTARLCVTTADNLAREGHYSKGIALYEKARQHDPSLKLSHPLALNYAKLGMEAQAEEEFLKALETSANDVNLLNDLGCFYLRSDRLAEAAEVLEEANALADNHPQVRMNLAECFVRRGDVEQGIAMFGQQLGTASALSNTGIILASMGQSMEAQKVLQEALAKDPNLPAAKAFLKQLESGDSEPFPTSPHENCKVGNVVVAAGGSRGR